MVSRGSLYILPVFHSASNSSCSDSLCRALIYTLPYRLYIAYAVNLLVLQVTSD